MIQFGLPGWPFPVKYIANLCHGNLRLGDVIDEMAECAPLQQAHCKIYQLRQAECTQRPVSFCQASYGITGALFRASEAWREKSCQHIIVRA